MPNIHTLREIRADSGPTSSNVPYRPAPSNSSVSRNIGTIGSLRSSGGNTAAGPTPVGSYNSYESAKLGISLVQPPPHDDGTSPDILERLMPRMKLRSIVTLLSIVQVIVFIITLIVGAAKYDGAFVSGNKMGGPSSITLLNMGAKWEPYIRDGSVWRLITPIFLHSGVLHIAFNLYTQLRIGYTLEIRWTWWRFLIIYMITGISASLWSSVLSPDTVSVGASGAIFGIIGADITYLIYNFIEIPDARIEACMLAFLTLITFLIGLTDTGIDNFAHLGGLISGLPCGIWFVPHLVRRESKEKFYRMAAGGVFCGLFLLFVLLLFVGNP